MKKGYLGNMYEPQVKNESSKVKCKDREPVFALYYMKKRSTRERRNTRTWETTEYRE